MHLARSTAFTAAFALGMFWSIAAHAAPDLARARDAYDRGVRAHAAADYGAAARAFAEADALAPTPASLEAALEAAMRADDAVLGVEVLDRAEGRGDVDASLLRTIDAARRRFGGRTGKIRVQCTGSERCLFAVDGRASDGSRPFVAIVGTHSIVIQQGEGRVERLVEVRADAVTVVGMSSGAAPPPETPRSAPISRSGLSPTWFFVALGATALVGGATVFSGIDAADQHDAFVTAGCAPGATGPKAATCAARSEDGSSATLRTNLLLGATAVLAVGTAALGVVFVRWSPAPTGGVASIGGRF